MLYGFRLHLHNEEQAKLLTKCSGSVHQPDGVEYVERFGFHTTTCCGYLPQDNAWEHDWLVCNVFMYLKNNNLRILGKTLECL